MKQPPLGLVFVLGAIVGGLVVIAGFTAGREHAKNRHLTAPAIVDDDARALKRSHLYEITCAGGGEAVRVGAQP